MATWSPSPISQARDRSQRSTDLDPARMGAFVNVRHQEYRPMVRCGSSPWACVRNSLRRRARCLVPSTRFAQQQRSLARDEQPEGACLPAGLAAGLVTGVIARLAEKIAEEPAVRQVGTTSRALFCPFVLRSPRIRDDGRRDHDGSLPMPPGPHFASLMIFVKRAAKRLVGMPPAALLHPSC